MRDYAEVVKDLRCHAGTCEYKETECSRYNKRFDDTDYTTCSEELCDDAAAAIEELLDELTTIRKQLPHWISVEDELPESGERVLIMFEPFEDDENISIGWLTKSGFDCYDDSVYFFRSVTHWMPLPKAPAPPKGVE